MQLKTHDGLEVDPQTHRLIIAFDILRDRATMKEMSKLSSEECNEIISDPMGYLFSRPVVEWNWKNGRRFPYVNLVFLGYEIQFGWVFDEIPVPGRDVKPPRLVHSNCYMPTMMGGSPLPKPEPKPLVRKPGMYPKRVWW